MDARYKPRVRRLAPLAPDAFLRWVWEMDGKRYGPEPITLEDVWWEHAHGCPEYGPEVLRRDYVRLAAKVRRNQRLGRDPLEGIC